jgi:hypothetical protein
MNEHDTLERLHELADRLTERLVDAERIRARFNKARDANAWPDVRPASQGCTDIPELPHFRRADDNRTH